MATPIAKPQPRDDCRKLHSLVDQLIDRALAVANMTVIVEGKIRYLGRLAVSGNESWLRLYQLTQFIAPGQGGKANVTVSVSSDDNPSQYGDTVNFTALISNSGATGTIQWVIDGSVVSTVSVSGGVASLAYASFAVGSHAVQAVYSGDGLNNSAVGSITQTVNAADITVTVTSDLNPSQYGKTVHFTAVLSDSSATGTIQWVIDGTNQGSPLNIVPGTNPASTFQYSSFAVGSHTVEAIYSGDMNFSTANDSVNQSVVKQNTQIYAYGSPNPYTPNSGSTAICTFYVQIEDSGGNVLTNAGGTVTVRDSTDGGATFVNFGTFNVVNGLCNHPVFYNGSAPIIFKIFYSGDANHAGVGPPNPGSPFQFTENPGSGGGGGTVPSAFTLSGPGQTQLGTLNTYTLTDATGSNFTGTVQIIVAGSFVTEYRYGGFVAYSGAVTVSNGSSNYPINVSMVSGTATFQMRAQGGASINYSSGDFANGYVQLWVNGAQTVNGQTAYAYIQLL